MVLVKKVIFFKHSSMQKWSLSIRPRRKKKSCVALSDQPISKNKIKKKKKKKSGGIWNAPTFCQIRCFFTLFEKKRWKMHPHCVLIFGALKKYIYIFRPTNQQNIKKFHLRATQQFSFLALISVESGPKSEMDTTLSLEIQFHFSLKWWYAHQLYKYCILYKKKIMSKLQINYRQVSIYQ